MLSTSSVSMLCLWWVLAALQLALGDEYRLPRAVRPRHYDLTLLYDLDPASNFSFFGNVDILLSAEESTSKIVLHAEVFNIRLNSENNNMSKEGSLGVVVDRIIYSGGYLTVTLGKVLEKGENYSLSIAFYGKLTERVAGAYISSYVDNKTNNTEYLVATKFRSIWARKAFPCFDEPSLKATFRMSIGHHRNYSALSNMPSLTPDANATTTTTLKNVWPWDTIYETIKKSEEQFVWSHFDTSPPMSTCAVAWLVSNFTHVKDLTRSDTKIRIWTRPAVIEQAKYALDIGLKLMENYNEWFGIPYPLPKLDVVAIPGAGDSASGWGLTQMDEAVLLHDVTQDLPLNKETVAHGMAHELAHQWFGILVTLEWWSEVWLFESFTTYIAALNLAAVEPEWEFEECLAGLNMIAVLNSDLLELSSPLFLTREDFHQFAIVSSKKAYVLIRMLAKVLGEEDFRQGIKNYLLKYSYHNTGQDALWRELTQADHGHAGLTQDRNLRSILEAWTSQAGYPVLNVTRQYVDRNQLSISQMLGQSFLPFGKWWVPLSVQGQNAAINKSGAVDWISVHGSLPLVSDYLHSSGIDDWVLLNSHMIENLDVHVDKSVLENVKQLKEVEETELACQTQTKYLEEVSSMTAPYRINYDFRNWEMLGRALDTSNFTAIPMLNRVQLISDSFELAWNGQLSYWTPLQIVTYLKRERQYLPMKVALEALSRIEVMFIRGPGYGRFLNFIRNLIKDAYKDAGSNLSEVNSEISVERSKMQVLLNEWACRAALGPCQEIAVHLFQDWMDSKQANGRNPILREMRPIVYCTAIARGNVEHWNFLLAKQNVTKDTAESDRMLRALACSEEVWVLSRYLEWAIMPDSSLRSQEAAVVIEAVIRSKVGFLVAKDFLYNRIGAIFKAFQNQRGLIGTFLKALASQLTTQYDVEEFEGWRKRNKWFLVESEKQVDKAEAEARQNMFWLHKYWKYVMQIMQESFPINVTLIIWRDDPFTDYEILRTKEHSEPVLVSGGARSRICRTIIVWTVFITITTNIQ